MSPLAKFIIGLALFLVGLIAIYSWPNVVLGTDGSSLGESVGSPHLLGGTCEQQTGNEWRCAVYTGGSSGSGKAYRVEVDWKGCWTARSAETEREMSGCVDLMDHVGLP